MIKFQRLGIEICLIIFITVLISSITDLLYTKNVVFYISSIKEKIYYLLNPSEVTIYFSNGSSAPFLEFFLKPYLNTIKILLSSILLTLVMAIVLSYLYVFNNVAKYIINVLFAIAEQLPDVLMIIIFQVLILYIFVETDILIFNVINTGTTSIFWLPLFVLSAFPITYLLKFFILYLNEQIEKPYYLFCKAKGFSELYCIKNHAVRNFLSPALLTIKNICFLMISNLLIIELIVNNYGVIHVIKHYGLSNSTIFLFSILLLFGPFWLFFRSLEVMIERK
ncbi:ABC transporter permease subunit [Sutcliffiella horikoshii]|uniref:ABC transporter permease subunit n=1 Tax=Sutcliffiella horikoshii TaxID=79883 RepID=UPI00384FA014